MSFIDTFDIEKMARDLHSAGIHLADSREDWLKLMMSMAGGGERLLDSFLLLSSMAGRKYNERENRREFLKAVRKSSDVALSYFIKQCEMYGFSRNDYRTFTSTLSKGWKSNNNHKPTNIATKMEPVQPIQTLKPTWVDLCRTDKSSFMSSVVDSGNLTQDEAKEAAKLFRLGGTKDGSVIYWQIDKEGRVRDGKIMHYDTTCHREKNRHVDWVSNRLHLKTALPEGWRVTQCLFGLHQIADIKTEGKTSKELPGINIVEAEKTAVICSQKLKDFIWMASGGMNALNAEMLKELAGFRIVLYPDTDPTGEAYSTWCKIAWEAKSKYRLNITVMDYLEKNASEEQKERKIDIADWIMEDRLSPRPPFREGASDRDGEGAQNGTQEDSGREGEEGKEGREGEEGRESGEGEEGKEGRESGEGQISEPLAEMIKDNPDVQYLIDTFGLA